MDGAFGSGSLLTFLPPKFKPMTASAGAEEPAHTPDSSGHLRYVAGVLRLADVDDPHSSGHSASSIRERIYADRALTVEIADAKLAEVRTSYQMLAKEPAQAFDRFEGHAHGYTSNRRSRASRQSLVYKRERARDRGAFAIAALVDVHPDGALAVEIIDASATPAAALPLVFAEDFG